MALIAAASAAFRHSLEVGSNWVLAILVVGIPLYGYLKGVKVYEAFVEGAKEGFQVELLLGGEVEILRDAVLLQEEGKIRVIWDSIIMLDHLRDAGEGTVMH